MLKKGIFFLLKDNAVISTVLVIQMPLYASLVSHVNCHCHQYSSTDWSLFHKLCKTKNTKSSLLILQYRFRNSPRWWSFLYINQSKYLSRQALLFPTWDWRGSYSIKANQTRLLSTKLSWCPIKTNQTRLSSTSEFGLSCLLSTNFTVIFGCLVCLVCCQPISPSYFHYFQKR